MTTLFFLFLITTNLMSAVHCKCIESHQQSLLHFKKTLVYDSSSSSKLITWNSSIECCSWQGVTCTPSGRVVGLDISSESISGGIDDHSSSLFKLQHLESLNLADNHFDGYSIPRAIAKLRNLRYLNLSFASYTGQVPIEISHLTKLNILDISNNFNFDTSLKVENPNLGILFQNLTALTELYLDEVDISPQGIHWCKALSSSSPNLKVLSLVRCGLSGPIDESLGEMKSLSVIHLDHNSFYSPVPTSFAKFPNLTSLSLSECNLQGIFPKEIFQIPCLKTIDLSTNVQLGGSFPEFLVKGSLQSMDLTTTNFSGSIPNSIGNLQMLSNIILPHCQFSGQVPKSLENLTRLVYLDMSWNMFSSPINSIHWDSLVHLKSLDLSNNLLHGSIPSSIFSPPLLETLELSNNLFSGQVPEFANTSSSFLYILHLDNNNLEGQIPSSIFNLRGIDEILLSFNNLSGFPFNGPQQLTNLNFLDLSHNSLLFDDIGTTSSSLHIGNLLLGSNKLRSFPEILNNESLFVRLDLSENEIQGKVPSWIWGLKSANDVNLSYNYLSTLEAPPPNVTCSLISLDLRSNQLHDLHSSYPSFLHVDSLVLASNMLKTFPEFLRNQSVVYLDLSENQIQGKIPSWIWRFDSLYSLNLSFNYFQTLEAPLKNSTSLDSLQTLDLRSNQLQGKLPIFLSSIVYLDYSENNFSSHIPTDIGNFISSAIFLSLSSNNLHGTIPRSICNTTHAVVLDLSYNFLSGSIPQCLTQQYSVLDLRRNNLTGTIPNNFLQESELQTLASFRSLLSIARNCKF